MDYDAQWFTLFNKKACRMLITIRRFYICCKYSCGLLMWQPWYDKEGPHKTRLENWQSGRQRPSQACKRTHSWNEYVTRGKYWISVWGADKSDKERPYLICDGEKITSLITFEATGKLNAASFYNDLRENRLLFLHPWLYIAVRESPAERKMEHMIKGNPVSQFTD